MLTNAVQTNDVQRPCKSKLLTLQIITVAAAVFTTAAYAVAFVIRVVAATNVVVIAVERKTGKNIGDAYNKSNYNHYYLRANTNKKKINNARNCCCNELISKLNQKLNANECVKKNNFKNYKCVVNTNNENIIYSTKALTQNNENTDFKDTRFCEIANNVNRMIKILENSQTLALELPGRNVSNGGRKRMRNHLGALINYDAAPQLALPFQTFFWFSVSWFSTLLFNMQTFATKIRRIQYVLYHDNMCSSGCIPVLSSLLWSQLTSQKSWPPASPASSPTSVVSVNAKTTSQTISAMHSRCNAFTMSHVMYAAFMLFLLPTVHSDNGDDFFLVNAFSISPETTTPEFDYASRGQKKFGDKCDNTLECGFPGSICDAKKKSCQCTEDLPVTNHFDKCGKEAAVNESCFFNEQCEVKHYQTECRDGRCTCRYEMQPFWAKDGTVECKGRGDKKTETYIDPAMIGVLVGMALMFVIICVVLRLFSQARWRENRTIFNTPNPRLMNVSLLRDSKLLHGQERRGSRMSVRAPSRQPSMASLRPHSPNPSLGKTGSRSDSANASNASATSIRSTRSNSVAPGNIANTTTSQLERKGSPHHTHQQQQTHHQHQQQQQMPLTTNITANPAAESVAVEIIVPEK